MTKQTGGPAFPSKSSSNGGSSLDSTGMTLRDYFAAQAMTALIPTALNVLAEEDRGGLGKAYPDNNATLSHAAYHIADAMLEASK